MFFGPYVPDKILKAVAIYIHRRNLHPSATQTSKEFKAYTTQYRIESLKKYVETVLHVHKLGTRKKRT